MTPVISLLFFVLYMIPTRITYNYILVTDETVHTASKVKMMPDICAQILENHSYGCT